MKYLEASFLINCSHDLNWIRCDHIATRSSSKKCAGCWPVSWKTPETRTFRHHCLWSSISSFVNPAHGIALRAAFSLPKTISFEYIDLVTATASCGAHESWTTLCCPSLSPACRQRSDGEASVPSIKELHRSHGHRHREAESYATFVSVKWLKKIFLQLVDIVSHLQKCTNLLSGLASKKWGLCSAIHIQSQPHTSVVSTHKYTLACKHRTCTMSSNCNHT